MLLAHPRHCPPDLLAPHLAPLAAACLSRGAGFLSLETLLHLAQSRQQDFLALMHKRQGVRSDWE